MFFTPELLAKRDNGMGLLWLAATLGSKSIFKKLPKRSVLTADIAQLCDQIAEPPEPLALRLSSNLMVGVVRVYKVKQEIFLSDVTTCFNSLKKVVQDIQSAAASDAQFQMAQASARPSAVTLAADPKSSLTMDFDAMVADWDEFLNIGNRSSKQYTDNDEDEEFLPASKQAKQKSKSKPLPEKAVDLHILNESHEQLMASFDTSFQVSGGIDLLSSQMDNAFGFDDNIFGPSDIFDISAVLGNELALELGEGWGSPLKDRNERLTVDTDPPIQPTIVEDGMGMEFNFDPGFNDNGNPCMDAPMSPHPDPQASNVPRKQVSDSDKENRPPSSQRTSSIPVSPPPSITENFSQLNIAHDYEQRSDITNFSKEKPKTKRAKRTRLLLDARTELTDEELKAARAQYLKEQTVLRHEIELKRYNKESGKMIDDMIFGIPNGIQAQVLVDFWLENFKVQVDARSGAIHFDTQNEPPAKRRRVKKLTPINEIEEEINIRDSLPRKDHFDVAMDVMDAMGAMDVDMGVAGMEDDFYGGDNLAMEMGRHPSSEDPGQGRQGQISRPPSALGSHLGLDGATQNALDGSQRSSLFPWDNAGASSSVNGAAFAPFTEGSDRPSVDRAELKLRSVDSPSSQRGSSRVPSQIGSAAGKVGFSPMVVGQDGQLIGEDFAFEVPADNSIALESEPDVNLGTLERNSFNFLEYAKMQHKTLPSTSALTFNDIVPNSTSTRHVAAAAFYHCLVLTTKDLIHLQQRDAYGTIAIHIV